VPAFGIYRRSARRCNAAPRGSVFIARGIRRTTSQSWTQCAWRWKERGFSVLCFYAFSLREPDAQRELLRLADELAPDVVLTMQSFAVCLNSDERLSFFEQLGCPVLQVSVGSSSRETWLKNPAGISPAEVAMNVALPEIDGRVFATVVGFKEYDQPIAESEFTAKTGFSLIRRKWRRGRAGGELGAAAMCGECEEKVAIILSNYPNRNGRIGNGVGLDTPASAVKLIAALHAHGYRVQPLPESGEQLMAWLQDGVTNDPEQSYGRCADASLDRERLLDSSRNFPSIGASSCAGIGRRSWDEHIAVPGKWLGNIFVGIQPARGLFGANAGDLSQPGVAAAATIPRVLPLDTRAVRRTCDHSFRQARQPPNGFPAAASRSGRTTIRSSALDRRQTFTRSSSTTLAKARRPKRRISAVIVDHLTPPLAPAGLYGRSGKNGAAARGARARLDALPGARRRTRGGKFKSCSRPYRGATSCRRRRSRRSAAICAKSRKARFARGCTFSARSRAASARSNFSSACCARRRRSSAAWAITPRRMEWVRSACNEAEAGGESAKLRRPAPARAATIAPAARALSE